VLQLRIKKVKLNNIITAMSSQSDKFIYDQNKRLREIKEKIKKHMNEQIIGNLLNHINNNGNKSQNKFDYNNHQLKSIEEKIQNLETHIKHIKTDGKEDRFLFFKAKGLKLLKQLDKMEDLSDHEFEKLREERRKLIQRLKALSENLKKLSIENLKQLVHFVNINVKRINEEKNYETLFEQIQVLINERDPTIQQIDDYIHQLQDIKEKHCFDENSLNN